MRLNKYIAAAGVASRRKADELTKNGNVKINGQTVTAPGTDVQEGDRVEVNGLAVRPETRFLYLLLNKPKGYITTAGDEKGRPTVLELITDIEQRLFPVGRLDANTTGMLLLTNDGDFAQRISHPSNETSKTYRARVTGVLSKEKLAQLRRGVDIGGFTTSPAEITLLKQTGSSAVVDITIHEGKNLQVRRMFDAVGSKVLELERTAIGTVRLGNLKSGHYRKLKKPEIEALLK